MKFYDRYGNMHKTQFGARMAPILNRVGFKNHPEQRKNECYDISNDEYTFVDNDEPIDVPFKEAKAETKTDPVKEKEVPTAEVNTDNIDGM